MLSITHELNSPLASIKLNIETLQKRKLSPDKIEMVLARTAQESERLHHLINNILATARMEKTGFELYPENVDLIKTISMLVAKYNCLIAQKIIFDNTGAHWVNIDVLSFELIMQNLIENAAKYSDPTSEIEVYSSFKNGKISLEIRDQGIGISPNEKPNVIAKFYRVGNEDTRRSKGTGLGLYLVSNLITEMNGSLEIVDNIPNGTIFRIEMSG